MRGVGPILKYALAGLAGFTLAYLLRWAQQGRATSAARLSPDETKLARLVEVSPSWGIDRNFRVELDDLVAGTSRTIYRSPDEPHLMIGTERLVWSKDGTKLLLVGRHFAVRDDLFLDNGDQLYFLHDLPTGRGWSNAAPPTSLPPIEAPMVEGVEFTEPVRLEEIAAP